MKNKKFEDKIGCYSGVLFAGFLMAISFAVAGRWLGLAISLLFIVVVWMMSLSLQNKYKAYTGYQTRIQGKTTRQKLVTILRRPHIEDAYLSYASKEELREFKEYIEGLAADDEFSEDFNEFLEKIKKELN